MHYHRRCSFPSFRNARAWLRARTRCNYRRRTSSELRYLPMSSEIRTKFRYSNLMYVLMSYTIRTITDWTLEQFLRTNIWEPLKHGKHLFPPHRSTEDRKSWQSPARQRPQVDRASRLRRRALYRTTTIQQRHRSRYQRRRLCQMAPGGD